MVWAAAFVIAVAAAAAIIIILISHLFVREQTNQNDGENNIKKKEKEEKRLLLQPPLPPGPRGLPIIGHLHLIGKNPHKDFLKLSQIHGPIMHLRFGTVDTVVVSSSHAAQLFLKTHDLNFATRPSMHLADSITYGKKDVIFGHYGPAWREMRKLYVVELLSSQKISSFQSLRRQELGLLVESLRESAAAGGAAVDLSAEVAAMNVNATCRMLFGKRYDDKDIGGGGGGKEGFKAVIDEAIHLAGAPNLGDYFPILSKLDVQGLTRRAKLVRTLFDQFFDRVLEEHENKRKRGDDSEDTSEGEDFVDIILEKIKNKETSYGFTREHVKCMMLDTLIASMDTTSATIMWAMSELIKNPTIMRKVKEEIKREVGIGRMVEEKDLEKLKYMEMVIKESFRLHPIGPILLPRAAIQDCTVGGFHIPKNTTVLINVWAIVRNRDTWSDPEKFFPERFEGSSVDYRGQHYELLPFGSGRRSCPGMQLGMTMVSLVVAQLAHCFDWDLPNGALHQHLDMTEEYSIVMNRAHNLVVIPTCLI